MHLFVYYPVIKRNPMIQDRRGIAGKPTYSLTRVYSFNYDELQTSQGIPRSVGKGDEGEEKGSVQESQGLDQDG